MVWLCLNPKNFQDYYLAFHALQAIGEKVREGEMPELASTFHNIEEAINHYNQVVKATAANGGAISKEQARAMNQTYKDMLRVALQIAKERKEELLATLPEWFETIVENYAAATRPPVLERTYETVKETVRGVWSFFTSIVKKVVQVVKRVVETVVEKVVEVTPQWVKDAYESAKSTFSAAARTIARWLSNAAETVAGAVSTAASWVSHSLSKVGSVFAKAVSAAWRWLANTFNSISSLEFVPSEETQIWSIFKEAARGTFKGSVWVLGKVKACFCWAWSQITWRMRGKADIERFARWGNSEVTGQGLQALLLFDAEVNPNGISQERVRRRSALQAAWQAGWMSWYFGWDPSLQMNLDARASEDAQHRQDRANQEYMQERQERSKRWSVWMAAGSLILSVAFLVGTAYFTGGAMSLLFLAQCISVVVAIASLWILHLQEELRNDTTLSEEERESAQDNLSFWQGILGLVGIATLFFDFRVLNASTSQTAAGLAAGAAQVVGAQMTRMSGIVRSIMRFFGQGTRAFAPLMRVLQLPALLRAVDKVLGAFGVNGARLAQMGMTTKTRMWAVMLEILNSMFTLFRSFFNLMQNQEEKQQTREKDNKQERPSSCSNETTQIKESCEFDSAKYVWIEVRAATCPC